MIIYRVDFLVHSHQEGEELNKNANNYIGQIIVF